MTNTKDDKLMNKQKKVNPTPTPASKTICIPASKLNRKVTTSLQIQTQKLKKWTMQKQYSKCMMTLVFTGMGCFKYTFSLQIKDDVKPHQALLRFVAYALQKLLKRN